MSPSSFDKVNNHKQILVILCLITLSSLRCTVASDSQHTLLPENPKFKILLIGEGISESGPSTNIIYPLNRAGALAMDQGVSIAFAHSPTLKSVKNILEVVKEDDFGKTSEAKVLARQYHYDPLLLAVIGHSSSGTTQVASSEYRNAGIPILMPIATSPYVKGRLSFRLPLNDEEGQAPVLVNLIVDSLSAKRVHIVRDRSEDASFYTRPLVEAIRARLPRRTFAWEDSVDFRSPNFDQLASSTKSSRADVILFVGYGSTAVRMFNVLRTAYPDSLERPRIVLTDGCIAPDLSVEGFETYLTAPIPNLSVASCRGNEADTLRKYLDPEGLPNFQNYGYDAMLILATALKECRDKGRVSRKCLATELSKQQVNGVCSIYQFKDYENTYGSYYVYNASSVGDSLRLTVEDYFDFRTLNAIRTKYAR